MKQAKKAFVLFVALWATTAGCALVSKPAGHPGIKSSSISQIPENSYFYFTRAQIEKENGNLENAIKLMEKAVSSDPSSAYLKKELALLLLFNQEPARAKQVLETLLSIYPNDVDALTMLGGISRHEGDYAKALELYEKAIANDPDRKKLYLMLGGLYLDQDLAQKAVETYEKMAKRFPDMWEAHFLLGNAHKRLGMLKAAESDYLKSIRINRSAPGPRFELIELYKIMEREAPLTITVQKNDTLYAICKRVYGTYNDKLARVIAGANKTLKDINRLEAGMSLNLPPLRREKSRAFYRNRIIELYRDILRDYPDTPAASFGLALYLESLGDHMSAAKILKSMGEKSEKDADSLQYLFRQFIDKEQYSQARFILSGMIEGAPENYSLYYLLGIVQSREGDKDAAIKAFAAVPKDSPLYDGARLQMAMLYDELGKTGQAIKILEARAKDDPLNAVHLLRLGKIYEKHENYEKASELYRKAAMLDNENIETLFRLGVVYDKMGKKDKVIEQMKLVIEKDPKNAEALNYLGYTYAEMGINLDEAQKLIERALTIEPRDGYITDSLGWVYFKKGEIDKAIHFLEKAVSLEPDDPVLLEHLGDAYLKKGDRARALEAYERSRKNYEGDKSKIDAKIESLSVQPSQ